MSQANLSLAADTDSGTTLVSKLLDWQDALHSCHRGASRPSYAAAGLIWVQVVSSTVENVYIFDGSDDILLGVVNPTANTFSTSLATTATKLATARGIHTNLGSESSVNFDGSAAIAPGVTGTLPITHGGTGATTASAARANLGVGAAIEAARWTARAIGEPFQIWDHLAGAEIPPTAVDGPRFIKLSAADAYNTGLLSGETVSGTAPDIMATAVIALAGGPLYGQTIHLINTERRFLRGGASGDIEADAIRNIKSGDFEMQAALANVGGPIVNTSSPTKNWVLASDLALLRSVRFDASAAVPTAAENRPRNISGTYYMRIF